MKPPEIFDDAIAPELLPELEASILARAQPGRPYPGGANRGGWKSGVDLFSWPDRAIQIVRGRVAALLSIVGATIGNSWAVVNRNGSYHGRHRHGVPIMGILFVTSGDPPVPTVFETGPTERVEVEPKAGRLVLCGNIFHFVPVYPGTAPRIVIAFDARGSAI